MSRMESYLSNEFVVSHAVLEVSSIICTSMTYRIFKRHSLNSTDQLYSGPSAHNLYITIQKATVND